MPKKQPTKARKPPRYSSVEDYLASVDSVKAKTLKSVIEVILAAFPELESKISWNVPMLHRNGQYVAGICAYREHLTFAPWSPQVIEAFKPRLKDYVVWKNCFQIPVDWNIDETLVKDMVRARLAELE